MAATRTGLGILLLLLAVALATPALAGAPASGSASVDLSKAAIFLKPSLGDRDAVGQDLVTRVQAHLADSSRYRPVDQADDAGLVVRLVTLNPNRGVQEASVYGETFTVAGHNGAPEIFLVSTVAVCPIAQTATCAQGVIHDLDVVMDQFLRAMRRAKEQHDKVPSLPTDQFTL